MNPDSEGEIQIVLPFERRKDASDLETILRLFQEVDHKLTRHITEFEEIKPQIQTLTKLLERGRGAVWLILGIAAAFGPLASAISWFKDNFKWN